ncbi:MAG: signal peptidase I, partial [Gemmatimonadota bacterium]
MTSAPVEDAENGPGESLSPLGHGPAQDSEAVGVVVPAHRRRRSPFRVLLELLRSAVLVLLLFFLVRALAVEAFRIPTSSMEGTLLAGDFLLVNKAAYGAEIPGLGLSLPALDEPDRGDVIVFRPPHEPRKHYVKRLLGLPGDTLEMRAKELFLNGAPVVEPYARYLDPEGDVVHPRMSWQARFLASPRTHPRYRP